MSIYDYRNPLINVKRTGKMTDPFKEIKETIIVQNKKILLTEIPDEIHRVEIFIKQYARARFDFYNEYSSANGKYKITIAGYDFVIPNGRIDTTLKNLAKSINAIPNIPVLATYFLATRSLDITAKNEGSLGNTIPVSSNAPVDFGKWVDTAGNSTSVLTGGSNDVIQYNETEDDFVKEKEFKVNYTFGFIEFHEFANGSICDVLYFGCGITYFPASRIWLRSDGYTVLETLEDYLNSVDDVFKQLDYLMSNLIATGSFNEKEWYHRGNIVEYNGNGYMYVKDSPSFGVFPDTPYNDTWQLVVRRGQKGDNGIGAVIRGEYKPTETYNPNDLVQYQGSVYWCKVQTKGNPPTDIVFWDLFWKGTEKLVKKDKYSVTTNTSIAPIPESLHFDIIKDEIMVIQNTTYIEENDHYTIDTTGTNIIKTNGTWDANTKLRFICFKSTSENINRPIIISNIAPTNFDAIWVDTNI